MKVVLHNQPLNAQFCTLSYTSCLVTARPFYAQDVIFFASCVSHKPLT